MLAFKCHGAPTSAGKRLLPKYLGKEDLEALLPSSALGHRMMVAGIPPRQYFWCQACGAHTGRRARKLTKPCTRTMKNLRAIRFLDAGRHPYEAEHGLLATPPRRLTTRDVGGIGHVSNADSDCSITGDERTLPRVLRKDGSRQLQCVHSADDAKESPFGFDLSVDAA